MEDTKKIQRTITFSEETWRLLEEIQKDVGQKTLTGVFAHIIYETHRKMNPAYVQKGVPRETKGDREANAKLDAEAAQLEIMKRLDGTLEDRGGQKVVKFFTYALRDRYEQEYSLHLLTEDMVRNQYQPNRERVEQLIRDKKVRWK